MTELSRRELLVGGAAGLAVAFMLSPGRAAAAVFEPNVWLTIAPDGAVTVHIAKAEIGQGIATALAQIVAEELEADWKDVRVDYAGNEAKYGFIFTNGSRSVHESFNPLARAGAAARILLIDAAAKGWGVAPADCVAERSRVRHPASGRAISYGELVARGPITKTLTDADLQAITLKPPAQRRLIGASVPRLDIPEKVDGRAKFVIDLFLPGMVYAKVAYPPTRVGGKHGAVDDGAARRVRGYLKTVVVDELVAVVAETYEAAVEARDALVISWEPGPHATVSTASIFAEYEAKAGSERGEPWVNVGDVEAARTQAATTYTAAYTTDFAAHAQMEPLAAVARYANGVYDIFVGTQSASRSTRGLAEELKVDRSQIRIHQHYLGGAFGRHNEWDGAREAALIAREVGRTVKLIRSREEDLTRGFYRGATLQVLTAALDGAGKITAWDHAVVASTSSRIRHSPVDNRGRTPFEIRGADHRYEIPNRTVRSIVGDFALPTGFYRAVEVGYTIFAIETFLDELAHLAKAEPLQLRLSMLGGTPRLANVLRLAAARSGWGTPLPPGVGRGIAVATEPQPQFRTYTAGVVQARIDRASGAVIVDKITCVVDCGLVVNPDGARAQVEGALLFGLSTTLKEHGTVTRGAFDQRNFDDYHVLRFDEVPEVDIHLVASHETPTGLGEPPLTIVAPALSNAIFAASGARVRSVPFLPERVLKALAAKT